MNIEILSNNASHLLKCVAHIKQDGLIGFPTETVYGLGARADHASAVAKIFELKGRPQNHPLIVHIAPAKNSTAAAWVETLMPWARDIPQEAAILASTFWPGPLTMILPKAKGVIDELTGGHPSVGLRCPNQPEAIEILKALGTGIAAPSANRFGKISSTNAKHVFDEFDPLKDNFSAAFDLFILDAGQCEIGIESTIVDLTRLDTLGLVILRPGMISAQDIQNKTGLKLGNQNNIKNHKKIAHSGSLDAHYAPATPLTILPREKNILEIFEKKNSVFLSMNDVDDSTQSMLTIKKIPSSPSLLAKEIYALLRNLDQLSFEHIYIKELPEDPLWDGIRDRLIKASNGSGRL